MKTSFTQIHSDHPSMLLVIGLGELPTDSGLHRSLFSIFGIPNLWEASRRVLFMALSFLPLLSVTAHAADGAFFDSKVLPILQQRCFECHSHASKIKGGLALDSRSGWEQGGDSGPAIKPGEVEASLLIKAVRYLDAEYEMPPKGKLPASEIAILEEWVKTGAHDPRVSETSKAKKGIDLTAGRQFWAFQAVRDPSLPAVKNTSWPLDPLDHFILAKQEPKGIQPASDADPYTWLRRVSLDLTGLPPSPDEIRSFLSDLSIPSAPSKHAYEAAVDRLLASKAYGERWARHWLDLTGYSDMMGTSNNVYAEHAWRYRDYLIDAFNADKPFDEFIREQIAGDLLAEKSEIIDQKSEMIVATGFLMVGDIEIVNPDKAKMEADHIDTQVAKIGQTFMGMTLGCVRCHDHKFDPIGLEDYYGIAGMLNSSPSSHKMPDMGVWSTLNSTVLPETPAQLAARKKLEAETEQRIASLKAEQKKLAEEKAVVTKQLAALGKSDTRAPQVAASDNAERETIKPASPADSGKPQIEKTYASQTSISKASTPSSKDAEGIKATSREVSAATPPDSRTNGADPGRGRSEPADKDALTKRRDELDAQLKKLGDTIKHAEFFKDKTPRAFALTDGPKPADMPIYVRGNPYAPSTVVPRGVVRVASWDKLPQIPAGQSGRLQLADWLADKRNPLTARVTVNRIWQKLFGTGIVPSVDYFGARGDVPTHPELLDHLATRFMQRGWSQKALLRALVLSRTYRLSSANEAVAMQHDPENRLYWRMNRQRLDAEALRDSLLAISGELTPSSGGPALVMEEPENCGSLSLKGVNPPNYRHTKPRPSQEFERTIYLPVFRNNFAGPDRLRAQFDFIDPAMIAGQRPQTIVPTQALFLLNNDLLRKRAFSLAKSLLAAEKSDLARLETLWLRALNRPITSTECDEALALLEAVTPPGKPAGPVEWTELCHSLLASNEFVFRL